MIRQVLAIALFGVLASTAQASTFNVVVEDGGFRDGIAPDRDDTGNINFGAADGVFYELGRGGQILINNFGVAVGTFFVVEVTYNNRANWPERFMVELLYQDDSVASQEFSNNIVDGLASISAGLISDGFFDAVRITDTTLPVADGGARGYGADIDSISFAPARAVPLPAAAWLFLSAIAGGAMARRKSIKK